METTKEKEQIQTRLGSAEQGGERYSQTNPNVIRLLEMLETPEAYSEQEISDIINSDEENRQVYRLMVAAKQGYTHKQKMQPIDIQSAWQRFEEKHYLNKLSRNWMKIAVSFMGVLLVSGIAFAAIHITSQYQKTETPKPEITESETSPIKKAQVDTLASDTTTVQPVIYDNITLEKMLTEIAAHYDARVIFANEEARGLRFHFVWNPGLDIDNVVNDLNRFEHLHVTLKDNQLIVE